MHASASRAPPAAPPAPPAAPVAITAWVGLGANLGNPVVTLQAALHDLAGLPGVLECQASPFYRTAPVDAAGPDFVNAVARLRTVLDPEALLDDLQSIERRHGRSRPYRNAPRTLDLDLLLAGDTHLDTPRLTLPHPRMHQRAFVLRPLLDLDPDMTLLAGRVDVLLAALDASQQAMHKLPGRPFSRP